MRKWTTKIHAIDPFSGELCWWCGPHIDAPSASLAQDYCNNNGMGYCVVDGELIMEVPCKDDGCTPDWKSAVDFELPGKN